MAIRSSLIINWGTKTCFSICASTTPLTLVIISWIFVALLLKSAKSFPKTLMAICALTPDSRWSNRWEIGCPIFTVTPFKTESWFLKSAKISSLSLVISFGSFNATSISELLGGSACSSNSALPVLRAVTKTSGTFSICRSATLPTLLASSIEVPGGKDKFTV